MYENQISLFIEPQLEKNRGFLRSLPWFQLQGATFTYHFRKWYVDYFRGGSWVEHQYLHAKKLESEHRHLVMFGRRKWLGQSDEFMYNLVENWIAKHPQRKLTIVTDAVEGLKLSKYHARTLPDIISPTTWSSRFDRWTKGVGGAKPYSFRSLSPLLVAFAAVETRRGRYVGGLEDLLSPGSLLVDSLIRRICAKSLQYDQFPLHGVTRVLANRYVTPFLDHPDDIAMVVDAVVRRAEEAPGDTIPPLILSHLGETIVTKFEIETDRVVRQCVI